MATQHYRAVVCDPNTSPVSHRTHALETCMFFTRTTKQTDPECKKDRRWHAGQENTPAEESHQGTKQTNDKFLGALTSSRQWERNLKKETSCQLFPVRTPLCCTSNLWLPDPKIFQKTYSCDSWKIPHILKHEVTSFEGKTEQGSWCSFGFICRQHKVAQ